MNLDPACAGAGATDGFTSGRSCLAAVKWRGTQKRRNSGAENTRMALVRAKSYKAMGKGW